MKKTLIALAVAGAAVATGANANELYNKDGDTLTMGGRAEARLSLKDGKADDLSRVRLNFLGKSMITDSLYGVGFYEGEFTTSDQGKTDSSGSDSLMNRYAYAGIGGNFGEVTYGKNEGALGVITDFTDIMAFHGNSAADKIAVADRTDNMISYKGAFSDLSLKASYRFADRTAAADGGYADNGEDGYSLSAIYALGDTGLKLGAGYADQDTQNEYMLAVSYKISDFYLAGIFTDGEKDTNVDYTGYEFAAAYKLGQTVFTTTYNNEETWDNTTADNIAVDASYYFKPNFRAYVSYNFNLIDAGDAFTSSDSNGVYSQGTATKAQAEDEVVLGMRYDF
ncbi:MULTISPECIES: porin [Vibrio]|uniref:Outer membrane protein OmpU n=1 Tax=Vibrio diazotrophicus TaxID=685 RepID=A0A329EC23_VIBDI|nr:porin [Vibrio diazotrophicus]PNI01978.1 porin [Vibrio diazotrophicus]RAS66574.1 outer membrane protein OmpU [Vibrio diazotrophicus]